MLAITRLSHALLAKPVLPLNFRTDQTSGKAESRYNNRNTNPKGTKNHIALTRLELGNAILFFTKKKNTALSILAENMTCYSEPLWARLASPYCDQFRLGERQKRIF